MKLTHLNTSSRRRLLIAPILLLILLFGFTAETNALITSYWVDEANVHVPASYGGRFDTALLADVYIDPANTNWIAWNDIPTTHLISGLEVVGGPADWLGIDDYFYLTVTNTGNSQSSRIRMDYNNGSGWPSGTQAVIYGDAAIAPNVNRANRGSNIDEAGAFNAFFDSNGASIYNFYFEFYDGYSGSYRHPDIYLLVDTESAPVPEPATMLLLGSGLIGLVGIRRRKFFRK